MPKMKSKALNTGHRHVRAPSPPAPLSPDTHVLSSHNDGAASMISVRSTVHEVVATTGSAPEASRKSKKQKTTFGMDADKEEVLAVFIRENPILWNIKRSDYRRRDKKSKLWQDQADIMGIPSEHLKGWFRSVRDQHTRLHKKSGDDLPSLTEREKWIIKTFAFLRAVTRHVRDPVRRLRTIDVAEKGRAEVAQVEVAAELAGAAPVQSSVPSTYTTSGSDDNSLLNSLQTRLDSSHELVKAALKPATEEEAFANYVRDTLIAMPHHKFIKAQKQIAMILFQYMGDNEED
ncbi:uncharacterized protein LOC123514505 [Portunus trituberculatus]|uniref:uncharacterized protein LOC123514505 n=1 Tax=Portunus trituberculatus TaxID=210409 RepID=UPI001E1D1D77|nr:uncharacterized protein LOC123514505 [Portunus trituberculatus]